MNGTSIRNIRRNQSERFVGTRCNRYGARFSFENYRKQIASGIAGLFKADEYFNHRVHQKALVRQVNEEAALREMA